MTRSRHFSLALVAAICVHWNAAAFAQVEAIGSLPGLHSQTLAASADGRTAVGFTAATINGGDAFIWTEAGGFRQLDSGTASRSRAHDASEDGRVVVGTWNDTDVVVWDTVTGTTTQLGPAPGSSFYVWPRVSGDGSTITVNGTTATGSHIYQWVPGTGFQSIGSFGSGDHWMSGISRDGNVMIGNLVGTMAPVEGFTWSTTAGFQSLSAPGTSESLAFDVSADGRSIVGYVRDASGNPSVVLWVDGVPSISLAASSFSYGNEELLLSADGTTIVGQAPMDFAGNGGLTFMWSAATGRVLIDPIRKLVPRAISDDGSVIALSESLPTGGTAGWRWTAAGGLEALEGLGGTFTTPLWISAEGNRIGGNAVGFDQRSHAVVWRSSGTIGTNFCGPAIPNSSGAPALMTLSGTNSVLRAELILQAAQLPPGTYGFFLVSAQPGLVTSIPGSQGTLCLGGAIGRYSGPGQVLLASPSGEISLTIDPGALVGPTGPVTPAFGQSFYFQAWFRDANPAVTSNFTDAATVPMY